MVFTQAEATTAGADITWKFQAPHALKITEVSAACSAYNGTGGTPTVDVKEGSTSILSSTITIQTTAQVATPSDTAIADNAVVSVVMTSPSTTSSVTDLCVVLTGEYA
jgi:hypothetical protein